MIKLGETLSPAALAPLYKGAIQVHWLGYSTDSKTLGAISIGSNSVMLIDATTNSDLRQSTNTYDCNELMRYHTAVEERQ